MMRRAASYPLRVLFPLSILVVAASVPAAAVVCTADTAPSATLLIPYVEVDVSACGPTPGVNTRVNVTNASATPTLAHVTLWTDMAVPVLDFEIYLAGFDSQVVDLHAVLCQGTLPTTGMAVSPHGSFSDAPVAFPSCNNTATPGDPPVYDSPALSASILAHANALLSGSPSPLTGDCGGWAGYADDHARGYLTIDVVSDCSFLFPTDEAYYSTGIIGFDNRLLGWFTLADGAGGVETYAAVHIEASPTAFQNGDVTFYGRYTPAAAPGGDRREPLPTTWAAQYEGASGGAVPLLAWREVDQTAPGFACGTSPAWYPLPLSLNVGGEPFTAFDSTGAAITVSTGLALASQRIGAGSALPAAGWLYVNLQHDRTPTSPGQGWVAVDRAAATAALEAVALDSACNRSNLTVTRPGTTTSNPPAWIVPVELMQLIVQ